MTTQLPTKKQQNANYYQKTKSHVVSVRLNEETMSKFKELEDETSLGKSELVRAILDKAVIKKPNPKVTDDVLRELSSIGNNINQLARAVNIANEASVSANIGKRLSELQTQLELIRDKL